MPEGDTIYRTARALGKALGGRVVTGFEAGLAKLTAVDDQAPLVGRLVERVEARGKWCLIFFSGDLILVSHMLMSGSWHIYRVGERWRLPRRAMRVMVRVGAVVGSEAVEPAHAIRPHERGTQTLTQTLALEPAHAHEAAHERGTRAVVERRRFPSGMTNKVGMTNKIDGAEGFEAVLFHAQVAEFHTARSLSDKGSRKTMVPKLGPDVLAGEFTVERGVEAMRAWAAQHPEAEVGVTLLNQRVLAGLGNVYKSEVAFAAGVHPFRRMSTVTVREMERMVELSLRYMKANVEDGGRRGETGEGIVTYTGPRRTTRSMDRSDRVWVYGRQGQECRRCGHVVEMRKQGEQARSTYWCAACQPWVAGEGQSSEAPVGRAVKVVRRKVGC